MLQQPFHQFRIVAADSIMEGGITHSINTFEVSITSKEKGEEEGGGGPE